jgi:internalin A
MRFITFIARLMKLKHTSMLKAIVALLLFTVISVTSAVGQYYQLPDTNLRNKLKYYPNLIVFNKLNIAEAQKYTFLYLQNSNISDIDGLRFFTSLKQLDLSLNKISDANEIAGLKKLENLNFNFNKLTQFPDLIDFTQLKDFQVEHNMLEKFPQITGANLERLQFGFNSLTVFPDISSFTTLKYLLAGHNNFVSLPDFSPLKNLLELHIHQTGADSVRGLENLRNLQKLFAWENKIKNLPGLDSNKTLNTLEIAGNELKSLPYLSNKPNLGNAGILGGVGLGANFLTFEDIIPVTTHPFYQPGWFQDAQKPFNLPSLSVREKEPLVLKTEIDNGLEGVYYLWFKDNKVIDSNTTGQYIIPEFSLKDKGEYHLEIGNTRFPYIRLFSNPRTPKVLPCFELKSYNVTVEAEDCSLGTDIVVGVSTGGGKLPFNYTLINTATGEKVSSFSPQFKSVGYGKYNLNITDSRNCEVKSGEFAVGAVKGCDKVFTPDGDGISDTYFIEETGKVQIFDTGRKLVREFNGPGEWDGRKADGSEADAGLYAIVSDSKKVVRVTLIR